ncbi:hypothetical protein BY996DRAFT_8393619 [Phakopsora pachyrhizi]|nr:hypothetical protein BY996DRAFT_8393619 [Phakopsora pachyrhizi]
MINNFSRGLSPPFSPTTPSDTQNKHQPLLQSIVITTKFYQTKELIQTFHQTQPPSHPLSLNSNSSRGWTGISGQVGIINCQSDVTLMEVS